jgi:hypothetical protein
MSLEEITTAFFLQQALARKEMGSFDKVPIFCMLRVPPLTKPEVYHFVSMCEPGS